MATRKVWIKVNGQKIRQCKGCGFKWKPIGPPDIDVCPNCERRHMMVRI